MDDLERYGDYNEYEEDIERGRRKSPIGLILKIVVIFLCLSVVGVIGFRVFLFNYYPDSMKRIYFTENLISYYNEKDGAIGAETQDLKIKYDDPEEGNFFADKLIVVKNAGELQISVRYNDSLFDMVKEKYGVTLDPTSDSLFTFTLERNPQNEGDKPMTVGTLEYQGKDEMLMYNYYKLAFSDINFKIGEVDEISWIRLRITFNGIDTKDDYLIPIYESYNSFSEYELSDSEAPSK